MSASAFASPLLAAAKQLFPRRRLFSAALPALLSLLVFLPYTQLRAQRLPESGGRFLEGRIRVTGGDLPPWPIEVKLELHGMLIERAFTGGAGGFTFSGLGASTYTLVITDGAFFPVNQTVRIMSLESTAPVRVVIVLKPRDPEAYEAARGAASGNSNTVSLASLLAEIPSKARKEFKAGMKAGEKGETDKAIKHYQKTIELAPDFHPAHSNLGYQYMSQSNLAEAEQAFNQAIKLDQDDANAYFGLGNVLYQTQRFEDAERNLEEGLKRQPRSALGHYLLGSSYARTGKVAEAEKNLHTAREIDPNNSLARMELVNLYLQHQRDADALVELKGFIKQFPDHPMLPQAKQMLQKLETWLKSQPSQ